MKLWAAGAPIVWMPLHFDSLSKAHPEVVVTALGFERYKDPAKAMAALKTYVDAKKIEYPVLLAGHYDKNSFRPDTSD